MSRRQEANVYKPYPLFPPIAGLHKNIKPYYVTAFSVGTAHEGESPLMPVGLHDCANWRTYPQSFSLLEDHGDLISSVTTPVLMFSWANAATTQKDLVYIYDNSGVLQLAYTASGIGAITNVTAFGALAFVNQRLTQVPFRNRNLIQTTTDGLYWYNGSSRTARKAGVVVPTTNLAAATGAAGVLTGAYLYKYTNVNDQGHESNPSAVSSVVNPVTQKVDLTSIDVGPTGTVGRRVYRTTASGAIYLYVTEILDNTTTTYTDNTADAALGAAIQTDNDVPPTAIQSIACSPTRVALLSTDGLTVSFSKLDPDTEVANWEAYPPDLSLDLPFGGGADLGRAIVYEDGDFYVFGGLNTMRISGDPGTGVVVEIIYPGTGIFSDHAYCRVPGKGLAVLTQNKRLLMMSGGGLADIGEKVQAILGNISLTSGGVVVDPSISYDAPNNNLYIEMIANTLTGSSDMLMYSFTTGEWTLGTPSSATLGFYSDHFNNYYRAAGGKITGRTASLAYTSTSSVLEWIPWTPASGYDIDYGWIEVILDSKAIAATVVPMLKVSYVLDGSNTYFSKFVDISRDFITMTSTTPTVRSVRVPVHKTARVLGVKIEPDPTPATLQGGLNIYAVNIWCRPLREARDNQNVHQFA